MKFLHAEKAFIFPLNTVACLLNFSSAPYYNVLCSSLDGKEYCRIALLECVSQAALLCSGEWICMCGRHCCSRVSQGVQVLQVRIFITAKRYLQEFLHHTWVLKQLDFHKNYFIRSPNLFLFCSHL